MFGPGGWLIVAGVVLVVVGFLVRQWAARYDLKDAALASAWTLVRGRRTARNPTAIEAKLRDIRAQPTWSRKAAKTAGTAAAHVLAQIGQAVAMLLILAGLAMGGAGFFWR